MFTGIIQAACPIVATADHSAGRRLTIDLAALAALAARTAPGECDPLKVGESIAVNGVCLTVAAAAGDRATFDVITETLRRSTLGRLRPGDRVNIERALRLTDRLGGHLVQGHIDGTAVLSRATGGLPASVGPGGQSPGETLLEFTASADLLDQMILKGSVAIDGVSLTLAAVAPSACRFAVALIPTTLALTTLGALKVGDAVNIETDMIGKWVRRYVSEMSATGGLSASANTGGQAARAIQEGAGEGGEPGITMDKLREAGFA